METVFLHLSQCIEQLLGSNSVLPQLLLNHFQSIGVISTLSKLQLITHLRELLLHEWLSNQGEYQPFFCGTINDFEAESLKYLQPGVFSSDIGDAMVLGLCNVLHIPIVVSPPLRVGRILQFNLDRHLFHSSCIPSSWVRSLQLSYKK